MSGSGPRLLKLVGLGSFWAYVASLFALGLWGLASPASELGCLYGLDFESWGTGEAATLFHQYRILKAFVLGFAVFGVVFRREIFRERRFNYLFLFLMIVETAARPLSLLLDGRPHPRLLGFLFVELFFTLAIVVYSWSRLRRPRTA